MQVVITRYHAATTTRGARYSAVSSSGNDRITIKENPEWTRTGHGTGHYAALRALLKKIGRNWPEEIMYGGTLNQQGHQVWLTPDDKQRSDTPPEPVGAYFNSATQAKQHAKPGDYILFREYQNGHAVHASYVVATERERAAFSPSDWRTWCRVENETRSPEDVIAQAGSGAADVTRKGVEQ